MKLSMIAAFIGLAALTACNKSSGKSTETEKQPQFRVVATSSNGGAYNLRVMHDDVNNVTCWGQGESIFCLPDSALSPAKSAASSAPKAE